MLSPKARAFCVENLLGLTSCEAQEPEKQTTNGGNDGEYFPVSIPEQTMYKSSQTVFDDTGRKCISFDLLHNDLWHSFHTLGTEMIITKSGRRMFPAVRLRIRGLDQNSKYRVYMDFIQVDLNKYRYVYHSSKWMISGTGESMIPNQSYIHPDSPMDCNFLNSQIVSFERIKLTNNDKCKTGQVSLMSMQRFQPRVHIEKLSDNLKVVKEHYSVTFPQTAFIAVTAYQNQQITRLKIARNPFAKGFREAGKNRSSLEAMMEFYGLQIHHTDTSILGSEFTKKTCKRTDVEQDDDFQPRTVKRLCSEELWELSRDTQSAICGENIYHGLPIPIKTETPIISCCHPGFNFDSFHHQMDNSNNVTNVSIVSGNSLYAEAVSSPEAVNVQCKQEMNIPTHCTNGLHKESLFCNYICGKNVTFLHSS